MMLVEVRALFINEALSVWQAFIGSSFLLDSFKHLVVFFDLVFNDLVIGFHFSLSINLDGLVLLGSVYLT